MLRSFDYPPLQNNRQLFPAILRPFFRFLLVIPTLICLPIPNTIKKQHTLLSCEKKRIIMVIWRMGSGLLPCNRGNSIFRKMMFSIISRMQSIKLFRISKIHNFQICHNVVSTLLRHRLRHFHIKLPQISYVQSDIPRNFKDSSSSFSSSLKQAQLPMWYTSRLKH